MKQYTRAGGIDVIGGKTSVGDVSSMAAENLFISEIRTASWAFCLISPGFIAKTTKE